MATRYVDKDAVGAGDGTSWANAWTTIDAAMNAIAGLGAGPHLVLVKGPKTYPETVTIDTAGTGAAPVVFRGDDGSGNLALVTIDGENTRANGLLTTINPAVNSFYVFRKFRVTRCTSTGVHLNSAQNWFHDCRFDLNGGHGVFVYLLSHLVNCQADGNSLAGMVGRSALYLLNPIAYGNGSSGIRMELSDAFVINPLLYNNNAGANGVIDVPSAVYVVGATIDGDDLLNVVGIKSTTAYHSVVINSIIYDCDVGIQGPGSDYLCSSIANLLNDNNTNVVSFPAGELIQAGAPLFTDEANDDYTLQAASPAKAAGIDAGYVVNGVSYTDIGAHQRQEAGGLLGHPGSAGGFRG